MLLKIIKFTICSFNSPIYTFSWRETQMRTRQINVQIGRSTLQVITSKFKCRLWREINNISIYLIPHRTCLFQFWQKMIGPNPSEMAIKVSIPVPTYCLQSEKCLPWMGKDYSSKNVSWSGRGVKTPCIKIGYSEPTRAESREGSSPRAESSRVT